MCCRQLRNSSFHLGRNRHFWFGSSLHFCCHQVFQRYSKGTFSWVLVCAITLTGHSMCLEVYEGGHCSLNVCSLHRHYRQHLVLSLCSFLNFGSQRSCLGYGIFFFVYLFIYLSSAKNILHKARKRHNINKYRNTGRGDATAMPITALPRSRKQITDRKV